MDDETYRERILDVESWGREQIALLSEVAKRSRPGNGESNVIHDAVAGMARRQQNAAEISAIETTVGYLSECISAAFYGEPEPNAPSENAQRTKDTFEARWSAS